MKRRTLGIFLFSLLVVASTHAQLLSNNGFETGNLSGWSESHSPSGGWFAYSGTTSPRSNYSVFAPPVGSFAAMSDPTGPSNMFLYRDIALSPGARRLSFMTYYQNRAGAFVEQNNLNYQNNRNQQYRVDLIKTTAPIDSVQNNDVLLALFRTHAGDSNTMAPTRVTYDISAFAGTTVRLRYAVVTSEFFLQAGVDDVHISSTSSLSAAHATATYGGGASVSATLTSGGSPVPGRSIRFSLPNGNFAAATTNSSGVASASLSTTGYSAGTNPTIQVSFAGDLDYEASSATASLTIDKATPTITTTSQSFGYDGLPHAANGTVTGVNGESLGAPTFTYTDGANVTSSDAPVNAGSYKINASYAGNANYLAATNSNETLTITQSTLVVHTDSKSREYGLANPELTGSISGIRNGDPISATYSTAATPASSKGDYAITATLSDGNSGKLANYVVTNAGGTLTVTTAPLVVTPADATRKYGDGNPTFSGSIDGLRNGDSITASYSTAATSGSNVGSYDITATLNDPDGRLGNYDVTLNKGTLTVDPAPLVVTPGNASRDYGDGNPPFTGTLATVKNGDAITATYSTSATATSSVGPYEITATLNDPSHRLGNYTVTLNTATLTVNPAPLSVTPADAARVYGDDNPDFTGTLATVKNGDSITATYSTAATAGSPIGRYDITATLSDPSHRLGNYTVTLNTATLTVNPAPLVVTPANATREYGGDNPEFTGTLATVKNGDHITAAYSTTATPASSIGNYDITATLNDPSHRLGNYIVTLHKGTLKIDPAPLVVTPAGASRVYGAANPEFTGTVLTIRNNDPITVIYATTADGTSGVGTYDITAHVSAAPAVLANYHQTLNVGTLSITPAPLTVTANDSSRKYGDANPQFTGTIEGLRNNDPVTDTYTTTATVASNVGTYDITPHLDGAQAVLGNYDVTYVKGQLSVVKAPLEVTPADASRLYGDANPTPFTGTISGIRNNDPIGATYDTTATLVSDVGTYDITATLVDLQNRLPNYDVTMHSGTLTVNPAVLVAKANDASRVYGTANPQFSGTLLTVKNNDPITVSFSTTATPSSPVGTYAITPAVGDGGSGKLHNYAVTLTDGTLSITKAQIIVTADNQSKILGAQNPQLTGTITGVLERDGITASYGTTATVSSPIGTYPITATLNDPNSKLGNYTVTKTDGTLTITYAPVGQGCTDGHMILQPINLEGSSVFKRGSTVPAKFKVCDASGNSIGTPGVVASFALIGVGSGTVTDVDEAVVSTTPDTAFRWDSTARQWIFNISTKSLSANQTYYYRIVLNDGSSILFQFGLK